MLSRRGGGFLTLWVAYLAIFVVSVIADKFEEVSTKLILESYEFNCRFDVNGTDTNFIIFYYSTQAPADKPKKWKAYCNNKSGRSIREYAYTNCSSVVLPEDYMNKTSIDYMINLSNNKKYHFMCYVNAAVMWFPTSDDVTTVEFISEDYKVISEVHVDDSLNSSCSGNASVRNIKDSKHERELLEYRLVDPSLMSCCKSTIGGSGVLLGVDRIKGVDNGTSYVISCLHSWDQAVSHGRQIVTNHYKVDTSLPESTQISQVYAAIIFARIMQERYDTESGDNPKQLEFIIEYNNGTAHKYKPKSNKIETISKQNPEWKAKTQLMYILEEAMSFITVSVPPKGGCFDDVPVGIDLKKYYIRVPYVSILKKTINTNGSNNLFSLLGFVDFIILVFSIYVIPIDIPPK